jgi:hypothetical protein
MLGRNVPGWKDNIKIMFKTVDMKLWNRLILDKTYPVLEFCKNETIKPWRIAFPSVAYTIPSKSC